METRDQWYKPNLLYNIHYRPPKKPEPPKMIVETVQFNPSVCTCGEHGCQPQYRMEKRVLWMNKEVCDAKQQSKVNDRKKKKEYRENKTEERVTKQDRKIRSVTEQMGLEKENDQEIRFMIEVNGNKCGSAERFKERMADDVEVRSGYNAKYEVREEENVEVDINGDYDDDKKVEAKNEECVCKNEDGCSDTEYDVCNNGEARNTNNSKEKYSNERARSVTDNFEGTNSEQMNKEERVGALSNDFKLGGKGSKEDQTDDAQTTGSDGEVDRAGAGDDGKYCRDNSNETADSYSFEMKDEGLEGVEIASAFGIMAIYCNSELHSWMSFEGDDASTE